MKITLSASSMAVIGGFPIHLIAVNHFPLVAGPGPQEHRIETIPSRIDPVSVSYRYYPDMSKFLCGWQSQE